MSHLGGERINLRLSKQHQRPSGPAALLFRGSVVGPATLSLPYTPTRDWTGRQTVRNRGIDSTRGPHGQAAADESPRRNGSSGSAGKAGGDTAVADAQSSFRPIL